MRVAICFSGQIRTWEKCYNTWFKFIERFKKEYNCEVDIFCHAWDFNTPPHVVLRPNENGEFPNGDYQNVEGVKISDEEKNRFIETLKPKSVLFENESVSLRKKDETYIEGKKHRIMNGDAFMNWAASQFYSVMMSCNLKKNYEYQNGFRYDLCFRMRYDLFFDDELINLFFVKDFIEKYDAEIFKIYSCHNRPMKMGDIFWVSDSVSFNRICEYYRWIPILGTRMFNGRTDVTTEESLYFFVKMLKMNIQSLDIDPKIFRDVDYIKQKEKIGLKEGLGYHELI